VAAARTPSRDTVVIDKIPPVLFEGFQVCQLNVQYYGTVLIILSSSSDSCHLYEFKDDIENLKCHHMNFEIL